MGYDYIIRVAINYKDGTYNNDFCYHAQDLFEVYRRLKGDDEDFYIHFSTDGHGGSSSMSCGFNEEHIEVLFKFTSCFPEITFTFYNQNFDFTSMAILVIKDHQVIEQHGISLKNEEKIDPKELTKYGLSFIKNVSIDGEDEKEEEEEKEKEEEEEEDNDEQDEDKDEKDDEKSLIHEEFRHSDPRNIQIHNEISRLFYDEKFAMVGGVCFGPTLGTSMGQWLFGFTK